MEDLVIVPDVHHKLDKLMSIVEREKGKRFAFLGDWFDDHEDSPVQAGWTAKWLQRRLALYPDDIYLLGNHCAPYLWPEISGLRCSGHTTAKRLAIWNEMDVPAYRKRVLLFQKYNGWLLSHAGIHPYFESVTADRDNWRAQDVLDNRSDRICEVPAIMNAGWSRGGPERIGGCTWLDWCEEFKPITRVNQVVGHTKGLQPRRKEPTDAYGEVLSTNWCIDTNLNHYAVLTDGGLEIKENV